MKQLRRLAALLLALAVAAGLLAPGGISIGARAAENTALTISDTWINPLYASILTEADLNQPGDIPVPFAEPEYLTSTEEAGSVLREGMKARAETITIYLQTPLISDEFTEEDFKMQVWEILAYAVAHTGVPDEGDYLMWQFGGVGYGASAYYGKDNGKTVLHWTIPFTFTYYTTLDQEQQVDAAVEKLLDSWDLSAAPDYLKIQTIYDYICSHVTYDYAHWGSTDYTLQFTAYAALQNGTAVCQGYAVLLYRLALELGIDCRLIAGTGRNEAHGWNIVALKGKYYNLDATWDAGYTDHLYFLRSTENFTNHLRDAEYDTAAFHAAYPMSGTDYVPTASDLCKTHTYDKGHVTVEATCTKPGVKTYTCTNCGDTYTESLPTADHNYTAVVTAPSCTTGGYTTYTCTGCGKSHTDGATAALGHEAEWEHVAHNAATRTHTAPCVRCGMALTDSCTFGEGVITVEASIYHNGVEEFTCTVCGGTYQIRSAYRIYGDNRYETAYRTADQLKEALNVDTFDTIVVAYGRNFADALAGSYLAIQMDAPILLTQDSEDSNVQAYIEENLTAGGKVYILGGTAVVSQSFEDSLKSAGINVERLYGDSRYLTNLAILNKAGLNGKEILVCTCTSFADSLSASAANLPILLVNNDTGKLTEEQKAYLQTLNGCTFYIIGGTAAVSDDLAAQLAEYGKIERVYGNSREETSVKVAETFCGSADTVALAYSRNFPDGLCGGPLAYHLGAPLLLVNAGQEAYAADYVAKNSVEKGIILGGTAVIPDDVANAVFGN